MRLKGRSDITGRPLFALTSVLVLAACSRDLVRRAEPPPAGEAAVLAAREPAAAPSITPRAAAMPEIPADKIKRRALLVGINDYKYNDDFIDLQGCLHDVANMRDVLVKSYGFREQDVLVLQDSQATASGILDSFDRHLIAQADPNTVAVFYYSGHGSQIRDADHDEPDNYDETLVTYDSAHSGSRPNLDLTDDVLHERLVRLSAKTPHVTVMLDSCHSGTATRGAVPRLAATDQRPVVEVDAGARDYDGLGERDDRQNELPYVLISGAQANELAYERPLDGDHSGVMTWNLARALRLPGQDLTFRDVMDLVKGDVTSSNQSQHPQIEGKGQDTQVFGVRRREVEPYILVQRSEGMLQLAAGQVHGVTVGSLFSLYSATSKAFEPAEMILKARVSLVGATTSELVPVAGQPKVDFDSARAVELEHRFAATPIAVFFRGAKTEPALPTLRRELTKQMLIRETKDERAADLIVVIADNQLSVLAPDAQTILPSTPATNESVDLVVQRVFAWARWLSLRALDNPATSSAPLQLVMPGQAPSGMFDSGSIGARVDAGQPWSFSVNNQSGRAWFMTVLVLSGDGSVSVAYPPAGAAESIAAGGSWSHTFRACTARGQQGPERDTIKVFFTTTASDFSFLAQGPIARGVGKGTQRAASGPFQALIESRGGTRGVLDAQVASEGWAMRMRTIEIRPTGEAGFCP